MKQLHYTHNPTDNTLTLYHSTGTHTTITLGHDLIKKLNYYAQTVPDPKEAEELIAINEDLFTRYHFCSAQKTNTANRAHNIKHILKLEKRRKEIHSNITKPCQINSTLQTSQSETN